MFRLVDLDLDLLEPELLVLEGFPDLDEGSDVLFELIPAKQVLLCNFWDLFSVLGLELELRSLDLELRMRSTSQTTIPARLVLLQTLGLL